MHPSRIAMVTFIGVLGSLAVVQDLAAQSDWRWQGRVAAGQTVEIKGVNGAVRAVAASGNEVRASATKTARRSDVDEVQIVVLEHARGVTICAVYPAPRGRPANECAPGSGGRMNTQNNDVNVAFTVELPQGVDFLGRTVNGAIEASGLSGHVEAHTVNGEVRLVTSGTASARTVNGSIDANVGRSDWRDRVSFETVNGGITVTVAGDLNADVRASTVNGGISSDFPVTVQGRFGPRSVNGTIGAGGRLLEMKTVNGSINLRRR
jgi:DUF4097 and DUF4098 domain-containing protein YvlB